MNSPFYFRSYFTQGRSKSLTHIDTLDPGMLVSRENSGDSRSEPDSTMQLAGGSQDRLTVPAMATPALSSPIVSTVVALTNAAPTNSSTPTTDESSSTDPAMRRRRLSNLYKVMSTLSFIVFFVHHFRRLLFLVLYWSFFTLVFIRPFCFTFLMFSMF